MQCRANKSMNKESFIYTMLRIKSLKLNLQSLLALTFGLAIVSKTRTDFIRDRSFLVDLYSWFGGGYLLHDIINLFQLKQIKNRQKR